MMDERKDARTDGRTWATLNALPHSANSGGITNLVGPTTPMLHTKSQGHRPSGSGEEDFQRVFTIYGRGGHLGHVTRTI